MASSTAYAELHCLSNFSFLRGASHPEELVERALELGYTALAITDRNSLAGVVRAHIAVKKLLEGSHGATQPRSHEGEENAPFPVFGSPPFKLIIGAEIVPVDAPPIVLLAPDRAAYGRLCRLITRGRLRCRKGACEIRLADIAELAEGLIGIVVESHEGEGQRDEKTKGRRERHGATKPQSHGRLEIARFPVLRFPAPSFRKPGERETAFPFVAPGLSGSIPASLRLFVPPYPRPFVPSSFRPSVPSSRCPSPPRPSPYRDLFPPDHLFLAAELRCDQPDDRRLAALDALSRQTGIPLVAANAVHYHVPQRRYLQDVLTCIREKCTLATAGKRLFANAERHLRERGEIARRYGTARDARLAQVGQAAVARTVEIARRCTFSLDELRYEYPHELVPDGWTAMEFLEQQVWLGARQRYGATQPRSHDATTPRRAGSGERETGKSLDLRGSVPSWLRGVLPPAVRQLLETELALIRELRYEHYFLTVWDICRFARQRDILCQGRGSAANSAVCYCLGITAVDPSRHDLLFERFISRERNEPPDIDVDFEHERREEVFQYIYEKYGRERAGITAEVITYRPRSAVRDIGKALGLSLDCVDVLAKSLDWWEPVATGQRDEGTEGRGDEEGRGERNIQEKETNTGEQPRRSRPLSAFEETLRNAGVDPSDRTIQMLVRLVRQILGFPRHLSQHVGGFVMTEGPLCEVVPLENGAMPGRTFIEWDKDDIDALGILKVDCLALGMLTAIRKAFGLLEEATEPRSHEATEGDKPLLPPPPVPCSLVDIPPEDPQVYDMICRADTVGVFQIESRAQMSMLPRLKPRCFYDLVIEVAIVRPGPIQGGMIHPYLRRRDGLEPVDYPSETVRRVLAKTLGVPIFQEQVMRLAIVAAGFTPGEADQLRRSMAAWRRSERIERFRVKLLEGMVQRGYARGFAEQIYRQIRGFGEYGFPESHAASFALLVYASAWLKCYHPAAFTAALLNAQPMGFYAPAQLIRDAREHGVVVLPVDVNASEWDCLLESHGGTEARRHGGEGSHDGTMGGEGEESGNRRSSHAGTGYREERDQDVPRSDCMAKGDGTGRARLPGDGPDARFREVRPDGPDAACGGLHSLEYRRRARSTEPDGVRSLPPDGARLADGAADPADPGGRTRPPRHLARTAGVPSGNRPRVARPDQKSAEIVEMTRRPGAAKPGGEPRSREESHGATQSRSREGERYHEVTNSREEDSGWRETGNGEPQTGNRECGKNGEIAGPSWLRGCVAPSLPPSLRLGFRLVRGLSAHKVRGIVAARREGPIHSLRQLAARPDVARETLLRLAAADAFRSLGLSRREALWRILALDDVELPLFERDAGTEGKARSHEATKPQRGGTEGQGDGGTEGKARSHAATKPQRGGTEGQGDAGTEGKARSHAATKPQRGGTEGQGDGETAGKARSHEATEPRGEGNRERGTGNEEPRAENCEPDPSPPVAPCLRGAVALPSPVAPWPRGSVASPPLSDPVDERGDDPRLPEMLLHETVAGDYDALGFSLNAHPIELVRDELAALKVQPNRTLQTAPQGRRLAVSGLVLVRQRPGTANGVVFITLEDETGTANLIVRPRVWQRWRSVARGKPAIIAEGVVERQGRVVHLMVNRMHDLSARIAGIQPASRDFKINSVFLRQQRFAGLGGEPGCGSGPQPPNAAARPAPANSSEKESQQAPKAAPHADSQNTLKKLRTASRDFR